MITGTAYGVILNDALQLKAKADAFAADPYKAPPRAPVLYVKPRTCFTWGGAPVALPPSLIEVETASTIALLFAEDVSGGRDHRAVRKAIGAACLALEICEPHTSFYRPAVRQRCRDGFLPLGGFTDLPASPAEIVTEIDGEEVHRWSFDRLARSIETLVVDISAYLTLRAGDLLLCGLPGDAPKAGAGKSITVKCKGFPTLNTRLVTETLA